MIDKNNLIEENLLQAAEGQTKALEKVLLGLMAGPLYIPTRSQSQNLTHQPTYPNDLISILGVQDKERVVVPVFTAAEFIQEWFGNELSYKLYSGESLFGILPEEWWITINAGQEIEKEISPWEITRLKHGEAGIKEILEESSLDDAIVQSIDLKQVPENDFSDLKQKISAYAVSKKDILKIYLMLEKSMTTDGATLEKLIVGVECDKSTGDLEELKEKLVHICSLNLIGNMDSKILAGISGNNILLGPFKNSAPFYVRNTGPLSGLLSYIKSILPH